MTNELYYHGKKSNQYLHSYNTNLISDDGLHANYDSQSKQESHVKGFTQHLSNRMQNIHLESWENSQSTNNRNSYHPQEFTSGQHQSNYTQEIGEPHLLAKKTNNENPVAVFGVVAKVDQPLTSQRSKNELNAVSHYDYGQTYMPDQTSSENSFKNHVNYPPNSSRDYEPIQHNIRPQFLRPPSIEQPQNFQNQRENDPNFRNATQSNNRDAQRPARHWTLRKPSDTGDFNEQISEQRNPLYSNFNDNSSKSRRHFVTPPNTASPQYRGSKPIPPRPRFSYPPPSRDDGSGADHPAENRSNFQFFSSEPARSLQHGGNPTILNSPILREKFSRPPNMEELGSPHTFNNRPRHIHNPPTYQDMPQPHSNTHSVYRANDNRLPPNSWPHRTISASKPRPPSQFQVGSSQSFRPGQQRDMITSGTRYEEPSNLQDYSDQRLDVASQIDNRPSSLPFDRVCDNLSENSQNQRRYADDRSYLNASQEPMAQEDIDTNYIPDIVARSYHSFEDATLEAHAADASRQRLHSEKNLEVERQGSSGNNSPANSRKPPPVPRRPQPPVHPFDPIEDGSESDRTVEQSPPPTNRPTIWSQRKLGGFSYLPTLHQNAPNSNKKNLEVKSQAHSISEKELLNANEHLDRENCANQSSQDLETFRVHHNPTSPKLSSRTKDSERWETSDESKVDDLTPDDSISCRSSPKPETKSNKPVVVPKPRKIKAKPRQQYASDANQTKRNLAPSASHADLENKFVFKLPSKEALKRGSAHPLPDTQRVPVYEGFGNVPKQKSSLGSELIDQLKSAKESALHPLSKLHERSKSIEALERHKSRPPVKLSEEAIRIRKNTALVMKTIDVVDKNRQQNERVHSLERRRSNPNIRGRSRSRDRLSSPNRRGRSRSRDRLSSPNRRGRSRSRDRLLSPNRRGRSRSRDRLSSPNRRGRSRSRDRLSSPNRRGRSRSRDRLSSPNRRGRSRSRDRLSSPNRRGRSRSRDRLSSPNRRGRSRSRDWLSSPNRRGRSRSRDRLSSPNRRGRSRSRDRLSSPNRRGRSRSRDRLSSPNRRGRSRSRDRLSSPNRRGRSRSRDRYLDSGSQWEGDDWHRQSERSRYHSPHLHNERRPPYYSDESDWSDYSRRVRPPNEPIVSKRAWVNDPRWRQNKLTQAQSRPQAQPRRYESRGNRYPEHGDYNRSGYHR